MQDKRWWQIDKHELITYMHKLKVKVNLPTVTGNLASRMSTMFTFMDWKWKWTSTDYSGWKHQESFW